MYCRLYRVPKLFNIFAEIKYMTLLVNRNLLEPFHDEEYCQRNIIYSAYCKTKLTHLSKAQITPSSEKKKKLLAI